MIPAMPSPPATPATPSDKGVAERYRQIVERIVEAARRVGRDPAEVTLVGASKVQPIERLVAAVGAGLRVFGENRVQEAEAHRAAVEAALRDAGRAELIPALRWHLIGPLQSNKAKLAAALFDAFHAVDRVKIGRHLDRHLGELLAAGRISAGELPRPAWIEVNVGGEASKHGFAPDGLAEAVRPLAELHHLRPAGIMVIPPFKSQGGTEAETRRWFRRARELSEELAARPEWQVFPGLLSMGMSDDYEIAIEEGATHVRVGSALFGPRD